MTTTYPLAWPEGWPRTPVERREDSKYRFKKSRFYSDRSPFWTFAEARDALIHELERLKAQKSVLSTNRPLRLDGLPSASGPRPDDDGIAVYFERRGRPFVMACDRHIRAEENMRSIALSIEAMRQLDRHGGGVMMERAFAGFEALPAPGNFDWWHILKVAPDASRDEIEASYRRLARERHPDRGGSDVMMAELNLARDQALGRRST